MKLGAKFMLSVAVIASMFGVTMMLSPMSAQAAGTARGNLQNNLGDLFILNSLFGNGNNNGILKGNGGLSDLGNLIVLDELFGNNSTSASKSTSNRTNLGDLIILNQLFKNDVLGTGSSSSTDGTSSGNGVNNLGELFILDRLFDGSGSIFSR